MIGLCGAHRTGKTTLAKAFVEVSEFKMVETKTSQVMHDLGFDPQKDYDFETRLYIQERILEAAEKQYHAAGHAFITDRTPIDMLAYTIADVQRENVSPIAAEIFQRYMEKCYEVTNKHFTSLIIVQPGIPLIDDPTKAPCNRAYIEHINSLVIGLATDERYAGASHFIRRSNVNLGNRVNAIGAVLKRVMERHTSAIENRVCH